MAQRVLVTAGASGIGRENARALAASGAKVLVCDIDAKALDDLAHEIPGMATGICDGSERQDIERMMASASKALGGLDVLVNNAGISCPPVPGEERDPDAWEKVVQVNLIGTFHVARRRRSSPAMASPSTPTAPAWSAPTCGSPCRSRASACPWLATASTTPRP